MSVDILATSWDQCVSMVQYCLTSTETMRLVRTDSPGRHLDSHTAPELWVMMNKFPPKRVKYLAIPSSIFFFLPHPQESSPLSANQRQGSSNRANIPRTCWAKLFGPRIYLLCSSTNTPNYIREAKIRPIMNQLYSPNTTNYVREQIFAKLRMGLKQHSTKEKAQSSGAVWKSR